MIRLRCHFRVASRFLSVVKPPSVMLGIPTLWRPHARQRCWTRTTLLARGTPGSIITARASDVLVLPGGSPSEKIGPAGMPQCLRLKLCSFRSVYLPRHSFPGCPPDFNLDHLCSTLIKRCGISTRDSTFPFLHHHHLLCPFASYTIAISLPSQTLTTKTCIRHSKPTHTISQVYSQA